MTDLDVIYKRNSNHSLTVTKNVPNDYNENVRNPTSHSTLSIRGKSVGSINCNIDLICWAYKHEHTGEEHHKYFNSN